MNNNYFKDPFMNILPKLDLHGEKADISRVLVNDFIQQNYLEGKLKVVIIHGKGTGVLKNMVSQTLKENKFVSKFYIYGLNDGVTVAELKPLVKNL